MEISINLANRPFRDLRPALKRMRQAMGVLIIAVILLGCLAHFFHKKAEEARMRYRVLKREVAAMAAERQDYEAMMRLPENLALLRETENLNQLFDAKALSWTAALQDLEAVLPRGVVVTGIEPTIARDGIVTLHVHVVGVPDKCIEFLRNLEASSRFRSPRIADESSDIGQGLNQKLLQASTTNSTSFNLLVEYYPDGSGGLQQSATDAETGTRSREQADVIRGQGRDAWGGGSSAHSTHQAGGLR
jgi:type IV pilus assembly protein PilN